MAKVIYLTGNNDFEKYVFGLPKTVSWKSTSNGLHGRPATTTSKSRNYVEIEINDDKIYHLDPSMELYVSINLPSRAGSIAKIVGLKMSSDWWSLPEPFKDRTRGEDIFNSYQYVLWFEENDRTIVLPESSCDHTNETVTKYYFHKADPKAKANTIKDRFFNEVQIGDLCLVVVRNYGVNTINFGTLAKVNQYKHRFNLMQLADTSGKTVTIPSESVLKLPISAEAFELFKQDIDEAYALHLLSK